MKYLHIKMAEYMIILKSESTLCYIPTQVPRLKKENCMEQKLSSENIVSAHFSMNWGKSAKILFWYRKPSVQLGGHQGAPGGQCWRSEGGDDSSKDNFRGVMRPEAARVGLKPEDRVFKMSTHIYWMPRGMDTRLRGKKPKQSEPLFS